MSNEEAKRIAIGLRTDFKCESDTMVDFCNTVIKALEQEPCADAISRQAVLEQIDQWAIGNREYLSTNAMHYLTKRIQDIPPVNPTKTGHWIDRSEGGRIKYPWMESNECSKCGENGSAAWNYCPNCGSRMIESEEV